MQAQPGRPAPAVTLKAIGHGRQITFNSIGTTTLLICLARETSGKGPEVVTAVRKRWFGVSQVVIINLADARPFPKLIRKVAEQIMKSSYNDAVKNLLPGRTPEEYVLIVPDWDGDMLAPLGIEDVTKTIAVAVIDKAGNIVGTYQGEDCPAHAVALIERAGT